MAKIYIGLVELSSPSMDSQKENGTKTPRATSSDDLIYDFFSKCGIAGATIAREGFQKPKAVYHKDLYFNISHSKNLFLIGLSLDLDLGVDIEYLKPRKNMKDIISIYYSETEAIEIEKAPSQEEKTNLFYKLWVQKEAVVKLEGKTVFEIGDYQRLMPYPVPGLTGRVDHGTDRYYFNISPAAKIGTSKTTMEYEMKRIDVHGAVIEYPI